MRVKGVKKHTNSAGSIYYYHRQTRIRLPDINDPGFMRAFLAAEDGEAVFDAKPSIMKKGSLSWWANDYMASPGFHRFSEAYQSLIRRHLKQICEKGSSVMLVDLREHHVRNDVYKLAPAVAAQRLKAWRSLCGHAGVKVAETVARPKMAKSAGHLVWTQKHVDQYRSFWPLETPQRLAMEVLFWTGARISDAIRLGPSMIDADGWLNFAQVKTGGEVSIPFDRAPPDISDGSDLAFLKTSIAAQETAETWICTRNLKARSAKAAPQWFSETAQKAGVARTAHGLRKARATVLAEAGATTHQIAAWTGHESLQEVEHYSKAAERRHVLSGHKP